METSSGQAAAEPTEGLAEVNKSVYDRQADIYAGRVDMQFPELVAMRRFRGRWNDLSVLDIGIGAGRTTQTLAAVCGDYVGLDISAEMVEAARRAYPEGDGIAYGVADARDLSFLGERRFDLVLFSFNGIDSVNHEDRKRVLAEMRTHMKADGICIFSALSLASVPFDPPKPRYPSPFRLLESSIEALQALHRRLVVRKVNRAIDLDEARERGWAIIRGEERNLLLHYVDPELQRLQLQEAGLELIELLDLSGRAVEPGNPGRDVWLHYVCRRSD